ncbi:MAG: hypothetical protein ACLTW9_04285 [Enterocloster sp.]
MIRYAASWEEARRREGGPGSTDARKGWENSRGKTKGGRDRRGREASREKQAEKTYTQAELAAEIEKAVKEAKEAGRGPAGGGKAPGEAFAAGTEEAEEREAMKSAGERRADRETGSRMELEQESGR